MIIDCISDLHGTYPALAGGDLLIIAGDITGRDTSMEYIQFEAWLSRQEYRKIVVIGGNHDGLIQRGRWRIAPLDAPAQYLEDNWCEFEGLKIYGSPWTPEFCNWHFMKKRGPEIRAIWDMIPEDTDILVTHGPAWGILDSPVQYPERKIDRCGCGDLREVVELIKPRLHVFGHIHGGYGQTVLKHHDSIRASTLCVNAAHMNEDYDPVNKPIRVVL